MSGKKVGYIRVSSFEQNPERQLDGIRLDKQFIDKASGKDTVRIPADSNRYSGLHSNSDSGFI